MKFFADTADTAEIAELAATGLLDGVTTNPSLIHKSGRDIMEVTREICGLVDGPVSAEVVALDHEGMMREAEVLRKIADNLQEAYRRWHTGECHLVLFGQSGASGCEGGGQFHFAVRRPA